MVKNQARKSALNKMVSDELWDEIVSAAAIRGETELDFIKKALEDRIRQTPNTNCNICGKKLFISQKGEPSNAVECDDCGKWSCCGYMKFQSEQDYQQAIINKNPIEGPQSFISCYKCIRDFLREIDFDFEDYDDIDGNDIASEFSSLTHSVNLIEGGDFPPNCDWKWEPIWDEEE